MPSTRTPGKPKPRARWYSGVRVCFSLGSEMAHWLFWQKKTTGALLTPAKTKRLADVALARGAVAEVGDDGGVAVVVAGADVAVALDAHGVARWRAASGRR